jgi:DivIVA domain-containing protein
VEQVTTPRTIEALQAMTPAEHGQVHGIRHTRDVVYNQSSKPGEKEKHSPGAHEPEQGFGELRHYVPQDLLDVTFQVSRRGYDRQAVDAYIERVNRVIAELKVRASPPAAVRHALDQAEVKVQSLLQAAREAAEEITTSARQEGDESTARAKAEAVTLVVNASTEADRVKAEADELIATARTDGDATLAEAHAGADEMLANARAEAESTLARSSSEAAERLQRLQEELAARREEAETHLRKIQADTEAVWKQRRELLDDIRRMAGGLVDVADAAADRIQRREPAGPEEVTPEPEAGDATESRGVATNESTPAGRAVRSQEDGDE